MKQAREAFRFERWREAARVLELAGEAAGREPDALRLLAQCYLRMGDFVRALSIAEDYVFIRPADTELLYVVSYCASRTGKLDQAADFGERVRLREPNNIRFLLNLARIYHALGALSRAHDMVAKALAMEPENQRAKKLAAHLKA